MRIRFEKRCIAIPDPGAHPELLSTLHGPSAGRGLTETEAHPGFLQKLLDPIDVSSVSSSNQLTSRGTSSCSSSSTFTSIIGSLGSFFAGNFP